MAAVSAGAGEAPAATEADLGGEFVAVEADDAGGGERPAWAELLEGRGPGFTTVG